MKYQGSFDIKSNEDTKTIYLSKSASGKYSADTVVDGMTAVLEYVSKNKGYSFDRWDFYIPDVNEKLDFSEKKIPAEKVIKAFKDGFVPTVTLQKWGKPKVVIASPMTTTAKSKAKAKVSNIVTL